MSPFIPKISKELSKLVALTKTGQALRDRGFNVVVRGEGVGFGEILLSSPKATFSILAESKRLTAPTARAVQTAVSKGTTQGSFVIIDGTGVGLSEAAFEQGFGSFLRSSVKARKAAGAEGATGTIILLLDGETQFRKF